MTLYAFTGVQLVADGIRILPAADPGVLLQQLLFDVTGKGTGKSLANKIKLAQVYYEANDIQATCAVLTDFLNEVKAQANKKKLTQAQADQFSTDANAIKTAIGCN